MERFLQLATENLSLRYNCTKCLTDLHLGKAICLDDRFLTFETVHNSFILDRPAIALRNLCGALGSKLSLSCASCHAKIGCKTKKHCRIKIKSVEVVLGEAALEVALADSAGGMKTETELQPELGAEDHEVHSAIEEIIEPDEFSSMSRTDLVHKLRENVRVGADMEMELDRVKEENRGFSLIIKDLESQNNKSAERSVIMIRRIEYLNTKIERMKEENMKFKSIVESENLKGGQRAVTFMKKIEKLTSDLERMNEKRKESEEEMRKGRQKTLSLFLKMEKMKQRIREREGEFKLEMECLNISLQRAKVIGEKRLQEIKRLSNKYLRAPIERNELEKKSLVLDSEKNKEVFLALRSKKEAEGDEEKPESETPAIEVVEGKHQPEPELAKKVLVGEGSGKNKRNRKKRKAKASASRAT